MKQNIFKKLFAFLCVITLVLPCTLTMANEEKAVTVFVDGTMINFDVEPIIEDGRTLVPMRFIFEALGAEVTWDGETSTAKGVRGDITVYIQIGNNIMYKNDTPIELDVPAKLENSRTLVPVRAISESFGLKVDWDADERKVIITTFGESDITQVPSKAEYDFSELSPNDEAKFTQVADYIRYYFEQQILFAELSAIAPDVALCIDTELKELPDAIYDVWDAVLMEELLALQMASEDSYTSITTDLQNENALKNAYMNILNKMSLDAHSKMKIGYTKTPDEKKVLLIECGSVNASDPMLILSNYIAVVPDGNGIRYFTLENSPMSTELLGYGVSMLCEIKADGRRNYGEVSPDKTAFLKGIDSVMK